MNEWVRETYENHRQLLFRVAWLVLRRADLAEDAVHTAFSRIVKNPPQLNGNAKGYVLKSVRNAAIDLRRQIDRRRTDSIENWEDISDFGFPSREQEASLDAVYDALWRLDSTTQEIIHLYIHEQLTFREIGELIDIPLQTVASRYRRGLSRIRAEVQEHD